MNKLLLKQIWNERRSNAWMWTELLLVSVVMWFIVDTMYVKLHTYFEPRGFDISNTYWIRVGTLTANSPEYIQPSTRQVSAGTDMIELLERLRRHPDVDAGSQSNYRSHKSDEKILAVSHGVFGRAALSNSLTGASDVSRGIKRTSWRFCSSNPRIALIMREV